MYECNPDLVHHRAGRRRREHRTRAPHGNPASGLHQRVPLILGSRNEVERIERYHRDQASAAEPAFDDSLFNIRSLFRTL